MTTILAVRKNGKIVVAGDGQVSLGQTIMKHDAIKLRKIEKYGVVLGFAGSTSDALALFERLESKLEKHPAQLTRSCIELSKEWRSDRALRRLEAMMIVADAKTILVLSGSGDVIAPQYDVVAIGSGGNYAYSAALSLLRHSDLDAEQIATEAMKVAGDICVYTNSHLTLFIAGPKDVEEIEKTNSTVFIPHIVEESTSPTIYDDVITAEVAQKSVRPSRKKKKKDEN